MDHGSQSSSTIRRSSEVWKHFRKNTETGKAECLKCDKSLALCGTTTNLWNHAKRAHQVLEEKQPPTCPPNKRRRKKDRVSFTELDFSSREAIYGYLTAVDRLSFKQCARSGFIKQAIKTMGFDPLRTADGVRVDVAKLYRNYLNEMKKDLASRLARGEMFSATADEWTGVGGRKYVNVNLKTIDEKMLCLGLTRIRGRCGAIEVADTLKRTLLLYGVDIDKDIFSMTTDGASVMTKLGKSYISVPFHLLCQAHGLHLAVTDLLYKKKSKSTADSSTELEEIFSQQSIQDDQGSIQSGLSECGDEEDADEEESDGECSAAEVDDDEFEEMDDEAVQAFGLNKEVKLVTKVRAIVRKIRKSELKRNSLLERTEAVLGRELTLLSDVKTRWSSMHTMLDRYLRLAALVNAVLKEHNDFRSTVTEKELKKLTEIKDALTPLKAVTEALSERNISVTQAEVAVNYALQELTSLDTDFSKRCYKSLKKRYEERRDPELVALTGCLSDRRYLDRKSGVFNCNSVSKRMLQQLLDELEDTIKKPSQEGQEEAASSSQEDPATSSAQLTFKEKLYKKMRNVYNSPPKRRRQGLSDEFKRYLGGKELTPSLLQLKALLNTVQPSSAEAERAFSAAGLFVTKVRNRIGDDSLNMLCVIRQRLIADAKSFGQSRPEF
ncbi:hypothetical protein ACHWQZ_G004568 [Mnemiopsis leidyi]